MAVVYNQGFVEYLQRTLIAVLATVSTTGFPTASTIYFAYDEEFNFYFLTKKFTRKYKNLQSKKEVALVIGTENNPITAQIQGIAKEITDSSEFEKKLTLLKERFFKNDYVAPLFQLNNEKNEISIFRITPTWIRWLDLSGDHVDGDFVQLL